MAYETESKRRNKMTARDVVAIVMIVLLTGIAVVFTALYASTKAKAFATSMI